MQNRTRGRQQALFGIGYSTGSRRASLIWHLDTTRKMHLSSFFRTPKEAGLSCRSLISQQKEAHTDATTR
jgi:hypothetical protein